MPNISLLWPLRVYTDWSSLGNVAFRSKFSGISISSPLFERGRYYEEYSARGGNERL
ncbi:hypothetical protein RHGRI_022326 [Rhododendron griersonianum]|uniref:Uncharacterized protein n=1 Tax=Rhododendron griersonianum TaxID=479676 RepID=A0AAV6IZH5_9ERIC|nr:hypothetical protein RHGRI_022326 [Rhododendron griersonianum]